MFACVDVDYRREGTAFAACVVFDAWSAEAAVETRVVRIDAVEAYTPGEFFRRELPCLIRVIAEVAARLEVVVVDGYVTLDPQGRSGLGLRLYEALGQSVAVIGVAKTHFATATHALPLLRGDSRVPLWITSTGFAPEVAAAHVHAMHGHHRIPTLLRQVDRLARAAPT
jgi:deoxyribonuclease V